jgi:hypothetical protein
VTRRSVGASLALGALCLACFSRLVADPTALIVDADRPSLDHARPLDDPSVGNDQTRLFLPHHLAIARSIARHGHLPLWDDRGFGGRPLVGNPQAGLFYPPTWLAWVSGAPSALGWLTVGHLLFSGLGAYRLSRTLGMGGWGSLTASWCVQASPYVLAQVFEGHYPHVWAACWYPWAFDAALRLGRGQPGSAPTLALILAATFLAGHPQEGYYLLIALGALAARESLGRAAAGRWGDAFRLGWGWALALGLTVGLVAVELIPDAMAQPWALKGAKLSLHLAGRYHLYPVNALQLFSPNALGGPAEYFGHENYWESVTSIGLVPLILAVVGAAWGGNRRASRGWLILVLASIVFASGRKLGLFALMFDLVPGMDRFRVPSRSLFLASLGASVLAGMGVDALRTRVEEAKGWARLARRSVVVGLVLALVVLIGGQRGSSQGLDRIKEIDRFTLGLGRLARDPVFFAALVVPAGLLVLGSRRPEHRKTIAAALGVLGLVELGVHGHNLIVTTPASRFLGLDPIGEALQSARPSGLEPPRIRAVDALYDDLRAGQLGLTKTNVNDSFQIQHAADLYQSLYHLFDDRMKARTGPMDQAVAADRLQLRQTVLDRMNVSLLVDDHLDPLAPWPLVASGTWQGSTFAVHRNPSALPRAYIVPRALPPGEDEAILRRFREVDPRSAVLMAADPLGPEASPRQPFTPAEWASTDPDRVVVRVETQAPGLLVVADTWMPGWSATVDGQPTPVLRGNHAQRVVPLPKAGRHEILLTYYPPGFDLGLGLTAASFASWSALMIASARKRRPSYACH